MPNEDAPGEANTPEVAMVVLIRGGLLPRLELRWCCFGGSPPGLGAAPMSGWDGSWDANTKSDRERPWERGRAGFIGCLGVGLLGEAGGRRGEYSPLLGLRRGACGSLGPPADVDP